MPLPWTEPVTSLPFAVASALLCTIRVLLRHLDLGKGMTSCINGSAGFLKQRELSDSLRSPRSDGLDPQTVAGRFRFLARARIQAAILSGNAIIARFVGL